MPPVERGHKQRDLWREWLGAAPRRHSRLLCSIVQKDIHGPLRLMTPRVAERLGFDGSFDEETDQETEKALGPEALTSEAVSSEGGGAPEAESKSVAEGCACAPAGSYTRTRSGQGAVRGHRNRYRAT
jgi:hypothetical protein